jgi:chromosome segregation ATPase
MNDKATSLYYETLNRLQKELEKIESIDSQLKSVREYISVARGTDQKIVDSLKKIQLRTEETLKQLKKTTKVTDTNLKEPSGSTGQEIETIRSINFPQKFEVVNRYLEATRELLKTSASRQDKLVNQNEHIEKQLEEIQKKFEVFDIRLRDAERSFNKQQSDIRPQLDSVFTSLARYFGGMSKQFNGFEEHAFFLIKNFHESMDLKTNIIIGVTSVVGLILLITLLLRT